MVWYTFCVLSLPVNLWADFNLSLSTNGGGKPTTTHILAGRSDFALCQCRCAPQHGARHRDLRTVARPSCSSLFLAFLRVQNRAYGARGTTVSQPVHCDDPSDPETRRNSRYLRHDSRGGAIRVPRQSRLDDAWMAELPSCLISFETAADPSLRRTDPHASDAIHLSLIRGSTHALELPDHAPRSDSDRRSSPTRTELWHLPPHGSAGPRNDREMPGQGSLSSSVSSHIHRRFSALQRAYKSHFGVRFPAQPGPSPLHGCRCGLRPL